MIWFIILLNLNPIPTRSHKGLLWLVFRVQILFLCRLSRSITLIAITPKQSLIICPEMPLTICCVYVTAQINVLRRWYSLGFCWRFFLLEFMLILLLVKVEVGVLLGWGFVYPCLEGFEILWRLRAGSQVVVGWSCWLLVRLLCWQRSIVRKTHPILLAII